MDKDALSEVVRDVVGELLETHLASVHEEITELRGELKGEIADLRSEMTEEFKSVRQEMRDGFAGLKSEIGAVHNRIDNEAFARKDLEQRIRKVLPNLPAAHQ